MTERSRARGGARKAGAKRTAKKPSEAAGAAIDAASEPDPLAGLGFEAALERLEGLVDQLEEGDLDLAAALSHFEEGVKLTRHCQTQLAAAEQRVEVLTRESGEWSTRPFSGAGSGSEEGTGGAGGAAANDGEPDAVEDED